MKKKTESEAMFEDFCTQHRLDWEPISVGPGKTPDYQLRFGAAIVHIEIKQIESLRGFSSGRFHRTVGSHVRHKIAEARGQLQVAAQSGMPTILLIHNSVDSSQAFGTEIHDFISAMYGEMTVRVADGRSRGSFHGRNAKLRAEANTSFSAVGHLKLLDAGIEVRIFENIYAAHPLPFADISACIQVTRIEVEHVA